MNVAFIPVRGGSKSIPLKNIKLICGKPLVYWTIKAACGCSYIDRVYVATDSDIIKKTVESFKTGAETALFSKTEVIGRSADSASDTASTEFAMLEFAAKYQFDNIVLIQATSPLLQASDLEHGFEVFETKGTDSVLSVVRQKRFHWENDDCGYAHPTNYDVFHRPRRQEFEGYLVENGAFYITSKFDLIKSQNRVSGNIKVVEMNEDTFLEIDEPNDWGIAETLMKKRDISTPIDVSEIKMFLTDCDGCLTDGGMYYDENGNEMKRFCTQDGMGFELLKKVGIVTGIISGEDRELIKNRGKKIGADIVLLGVKDKVKAIIELSQKYRINVHEIAYLGDDLNDIDAIHLVGLGCSVPNGTRGALEAAIYVTKKAGGYGAVREVADLLVEAKR